MKKRVAIVQAASTPDPEENFRKAVKACEEAAAYGPELVLFPECFMCYFAKTQTMEEKSRVVRENYAKFVDGMCRLSEKYGFWTVFGTYEPAEDPDSIRCYNTICVVDETGTLRYRYRKTHLYDAFSNKESDFVIPGDRLSEVLETPIGPAAILTCFEMRFPEIARKLTLDGAKILLHPTAWVGGKTKEEQYKTLCRARALENTVYFISADQCDRTHSGGSLMADPMGAVLCGAAEEETVIFGEVDTDRIERVREILPVLALRRENLY